MNDEDNDAETLWIPICGVLTVLGVSAMCFAAWIGA